MAPQLTDKQFDRLLARLPAESPMSYDQARVALMLGDSLRLHAERTGVRWYVDVNEPLDYLKPDGKPARAFPDLFVVTDFVRPNEALWHLRTWVSRRVPDVVLEVAVRQSMNRDLEGKRTLYFDLGVQEYFVFDVHAIRIPGQLTGWARGEDGESTRIAPVETDECQRLPSRVLGLDLGVADAPQGAQLHRVLRAYLTGSASPLPTYEEAEQARLEAEIARLRAELERCGP